MRIRAEDLTAMLRLAGEAGELPVNSDARRLHLLDGVVRLAGGQSGFLFILGRDPINGSLVDDGGPVLFHGMTPQQESIIENYMRHAPWPRDPVVPVASRKPGNFLTVRRQHVVDEGEWYNTDYFDRFRRPLELDHQLYSRLPLPDGGMLAIAVCRPIGDRPFTDRECDLLDTFHQQAGRLYGTPDSPQAGSVAAAAVSGLAGLPTRTNGGTLLGTPDVLLASDAAGAPVDPRVSALPPRLQPVLRHFLEGDSEKQVAMKLGLSKHTVHEYAKMLYRRLEVSSRSELLAQFVARVAV